MLAIMLLNEDKRGCQWMRRRVRLRREIKYFKREREDYKEAAQGGSVGGRSTESEWMTQKLLLLLRWCFYSCFVSACGIFSQFFLAKYTMRASLKIH